MENQFPLPEIPFKNPEEEISHLQKLIAEKEKALKNIGLKTEALTPARQTLAEYKTVPIATALPPQY